ncbi:hypothetical protein L6303_06020 [archaeon]|nr:hypothetical protein [Nanoarchaeota archaeon]MBU4452141.1 hypothetical protein [Nanoarchaeota archaeon]MCG2724274.1 hypothetical protein [archaeon]
MSDCEFLTEEMMNKLAPPMAQAPVAPEQKNTTKRNGKLPTPTELMARHPDKLVRAKEDVTTDEIKDNWRRTALKFCPFNPEQHTKGSVNIFENIETGEGGFKCFHASDKDKTYIDIVKLIEHKTRDMEKLVNDEENAPIRNKALEILEKGEPVEYLLSAAQKFHIGDTNLLKGLLCSVASQSILNSKGIQPKLSGRSGAGKTHACQTIIYLMPLENYLESSLSAKALFYLGIAPGTTIFSDDVDFSEGLEGVIKRSTTNFQRETIHSTVDKQGKPSKLVIPARINWWLTSVDDEQSGQLINREFTFDIDESKEQDEAVCAKQIQDAAFGHPEFYESEDVLVCREIIREIHAQNMMVRIPYAVDFLWSDKSNRRNFPMFVDMIRAFTVLRSKQRKVDDTGCLIANLADFDDARALYCSRAENQSLKLNQREINICNMLSAGDMDAKELQEKMNMSQSYLHKLIHGRNDRKETGLLHKVRGLHAELENTGDEVSRRTRWVYSLKGFKKWDVFNSVVTLPDESRIKWEKELSLCKSGEKWEYGHSSSSDSENLGHRYGNKSGIEPIDSENLGHTNENISDEEPLKENDLCPKILTMPDLCPNNINNSKGSIPNFPEKEKHIGD